MATFIVSQGQQQADLQGGTGAWQANNDSTSGHGYNVGDVKVYSGSAPGTANAAETGTLGIDWVLPNPAFAAPSAALPSVITANSVTSVTAAASITAGYARILANGDTGVLSTTQRRGQFDVGTSGTSMILNTTTITIGATASLTALTITHGWETMAIGLLVTTSDLNNAIGNKARDFFSLYTSSKALSTRLKLYQDSDLQGIGFQAADIAAIRGFEQFADTLCAVFDGSAALPEATNFLADVSAIIGVGL